MLTKILPSRLSSTYFLTSSFFLPKITSSPHTYLNSCRFISTSSPEQSSGDRKEEIVIVGGGIAGLSTALALHRVGIRSLVLEQSDSLRTEGASISLFKNGWRVLDMLGVGNELRRHFLDIQGVTIKTLEGKELQSINFKDGDPSQEMRAVERSILLKTLADHLPPNTLQFSSKLAKIEQDDGTGETKLHLTNGSQLSSKIVIGCDGIWSPIARWMGFSETKYSGHSCYRGLALFPNGHPYQPITVQYYAKGMRGGFMPLSPTKVFWFFNYNNPSPGPKVTDPTVLKRQALDLLKNWPSEMLELVELSLDDTISEAMLQDRWLWPVITPPVYKGGVVLAGDAWHPMTPNLGQGGCCGLEDAVVLAKKLSNAMKSKRGSIEDALRSYENERWARVFPMTVKANLAGKIQHSKSSVVCFIRDSYMVRKQGKPGKLLEHTNFTCEPL